MEGEKKNKGLSNFQFRWGGRGKEYILEKLTFQCEKGKREKKIIIKYIYLCQGERKRRILAIQTPIFKGEKNVLPGRKRKKRGGLSIHHPISLGGKGGKGKGRCSNSWAIMKGGRCEKRIPPHFYEEGTRLLGLEQRGNKPTRGGRKRREGRNFFFIFGE